MSMRDEMADKVSKMNDWLYKETMSASSCYMDDSIASRVVRNMERQLHLFKDKNIEYGETYTTGPSISRMLYDDSHRKFFMNLMIVKLCRYAHNMDKEEGHDDSLIDLAVYSNILLALDQQERGE